MYARILAPIDGSPIGERGLQEAIRIAAALKSPLVLLHVIDEFALMVASAARVSFDQQHEALTRQGEALLADGVHRAAEAGVQAQTLLREIKGGRVADAIVAEAAGQGCELVVMGTHGRHGLRRMVLGSDAEQVVRRARVPVLLVGPHEGEPGR